MPRGGENPRPSLLNAAEDIFLRWACFHVHAIPSRRGPVARSRGGRRHAGRRSLHRTRSNRRRFPAPRARWTRATRGSPSRAHAAEGAGVEMPGRLSSVQDGRRCHRSTPPRETSVAERIARVPDRGEPRSGACPPGPRMPCGWGCGAKLTNGQMRRHFTDCPRRPTVQETMRHLPRKPNRGGRPPGPRMLCGWHCGTKLTATKMRRHFGQCPRRPKVSLDDAMCSSIELGANRP
jgi:hypothetical protein